MTNLLFGISLSALLSTTSLLVVLFRVSPLSSPSQAIPAFLLSVFLSVASVGSLLFYALWTKFPVHTWDTGKLLTVSIRQGMLLSIGTVAVLIFGMLGLLSWWVILLLYAVCILIELAINA
ncbi:MAG: hypothetical protein JWM56_734 [Candidatus Peribacteria bacterium]|nr:hypothetical protein [Candidatus Peribacteria bacterium]